MARARLRPARRAWTVAWLGGSVLGIANGLAREAGYKRRVGARAADLISAASLVLLLGGYFALLQRRWPLATRREAALVGATWTVLTVAFEFGFGHYVDRKPWRELVEDYDLSEGRVWPLVLAWIGAGPVVTRELLRG